MFWGGKKSNYQGEKKTENHFQSDADGTQNADFGLLVSRDKFSVSEIHQWRWKETKCSKFLWCSFFFFLKLRNDELSSHITTVQRAAWQHFRQHWRLVAMHSNPSQGIGRFSSERLCYQRNTKLQEVSTELKNHWWATQWSEVCHWGSDSSWALNASWIATLVLAYQCW